MKFRYAVQLFQDPEQPEVWVAKVPAVPGVYSDGDTKEEALRNAQEALEAVLEVMQAEGLSIPPPEEVWLEVELDAA